ncbi:hypothetical protein ACE1B6_15765 [Aerosakkonemataceae cyanobacterium BLCC-F154]|uniref:Uncharacterized protein n=1 Tax=Floridaenema fluviatile BLCC-F154 TaxID=3153640 RepID=A0ABV4YD05_9CYAN
MAKDYLLFIHGVNTRDKLEKPSYADKLFQLIQESADSSLQLEKIPLYWGDINEDAQERLRNTFKQSTAWNELWFQDFRANQLLQFAGDAALYLSRTIGSEVVQRIKEQAKEGLKGYDPNKDRLHLITHSWGTVILFDILFAKRWNYPNVPAHQDVMDIRNTLFGLSPSPYTGIELASIHTMGSPIALFSLLHVDGSTHNFQQLFEELLQNLYNIRNRQLPWLNFLHPGDPVAWPLEKLLFDSLNGETKYLDLADIVIQREDFSDFLFKMVSQKILALVHGGDAHGSYWSSKQVADTIAQTIKNEARQAKIQVSNRELISG